MSKGPWRNRILSIFELVTVLGFVLSVGQFLVGSVKELPEWTYAFSYIIFMIALIAIVFYEARYRRISEIRLTETLGQKTRLERGVSELQEKLERWQMSPELLHPVFHSIRDTTMAVLREELPADRVPERVRSLSRDVLTKTSQIFSNHFAASCPTCIKLFTGANELRTFARDQLSEHKRDDDDGKRVYQVDKNTDFHMIMSGSRRWFYSGDLKKEGTHYDNERKDWEKYYTCVAIVPIMQSRGTLAERENDILGFLCADSLRAETFPESESIELLACIADSLYVTFSLYFALTQPKGGEEVDHDT